MEGKDLNTQEVGTDVLEHKKMGFVPSLLPFSTVPKKQLIRALSLLTWLLRSECFTPRPPVEIHYCLASLLFEGGGILQG